MNKKAHAWRDATYLIGPHADYASAITDLAGAMYHLPTKVDATSLEVDAMSYSRFKLLDHVAESRFEIRTGDVTTSDKHDSTHGKVIIDAIILSLPSVDTINSLLLGMVEPNIDITTFYLATINAILNMICLSAAAIVAIICTVRVVMNSKHSDAPFITTVMRFGSAFVCLDKVRTYMTSSFITKLLWPTVADMPTDAQRQARRDRTRRMRAASRLLPRGRRNGRRSRLHADVRMMMA